MNWTSSRKVWNEGNPVLVNFWAAWSQRRPILAGVLDEVAAESKGWAKVIKVSVDDNPHLGTRYGIKSVPTLLCFVNGEMRTKISPARTRSSKARMTSSTGVI